MEALEQLRSKACKFFILFFLAHVPIVALMSYLIGNTNVVFTTILAAFFALVPAISWKVRGNNSLTYYLISVSSMLIVALMVYALSGHSWQIDMHMYFFAVLAMLAAFSDWRTILVGTVAIALHHLILNFALPLAVFPEGANFWRVVFHAVIVIVETAVLVYITYQVSNAVVTSENLAKENDKQQELMTALEEEKSAREVARKEHQAQTERMSAQFNETVGVIVQRFSEQIQAMKKSADSLLQVAQESAGHSDNISDRTQNSLEDIQSISAAAEEMNASIRDIAGQINQSNKISEDAFAKVQASENIVAELQQAADNVSNVTGLIYEITEQTNLLALNATIEAARAGEAGKGFAVVAHEVKELAGRASKATDEINKEIEMAQQKTRETVEVIQSIGGIVSELREISQRVATSVDEQSNASGEIAKLIGSAATGAQDINSKVVEMKATTQQCENEAGALEEIGSTLSDSNQELESSVREFTEVIKG